MTRFVHRPVVLGALCAMTLPMLATVQPANAATRADLIVASMAVSRTSVVRGTTLKVTDRTRNVGKAKARSTTTRYLLSRDRVKGRDTALTSRAVVALRPGRTSLGARTIRIPTKTAVGRWYVLACADATARVRESREGNNCRASAAVTVKAPTPPPAPKPRLTGVYPRTATPATLGYTLEDDNAADPMTLFPFAGGSSTTTDSRGNTYTLTVPAGAVLSETTITMTPVASTTGLPGTNPIAVEVTPHGLLLQKSATLEITPASPIPVGRQSGFTAGKDGAGLHLHPLAPGAPIKLRLTHFSTPGVADMTPAQQTGLAAQPPARTAEQYENDAAALINAERSAQLSGQAGDPAFADKLLGITEAYHHDIVDPALVAARSNLDAAPAAIAQALQWVRQVELLGMTSPYLDAAKTAVMQKIIVLLHLMLDRAEAGCLSHDLPQILKLLGLARTLQLLGDSRGEEAAQAASDCFDFTVTIDADESLDTHVTESGYSLSAMGDWSTTTGTFHIDDLTTQQATPVLNVDSFGYNRTETVSCPDAPSAVSTKNTESMQAGQVLVKLLLDLNQYAAAPAADAPAGELRVAVMAPPMGTAEVVNDSCYGPPDEPVTEPDPGWMRSWFRFRELSPAATAGLYDGSLAIPLYADERSGARLLDYQHTRTTDLPDEEGTTVGETVSITVDHTPQ